MDDLTKTFATEAKNLTLYAGNLVMKPLYLSKTPGQTLSIY